MTPICHLSTVHQPTDDRIFYKECVSLASRGYEVTFIVPAPASETRDGVKIVALPQYRNRMARMTAGMIIAFFRVLSGGARLIHFHDPELIPLGLIFKLLGRKVIYDVHELVYHHIEMKTWLPTMVRRTAAAIYRFAEKLGVRFFDALILVVDDGQFRSWFYGNYQAYSEKFVTVKNFALLSFIDSLPQSPVENECPVIIYAGGLQRRRGIRETVRATALCPVKTRLLLFGSWDEPSYREECMQEDGWKNVTDMGFKRLEDLYPWMKASDLGIIMLWPETNYLTSLPVKVFEYMACSLPVLASDFPFWRKTFGECAVFSDPLSAEDIAAKMNELLNDKNRMKELGEKGRGLVREKYSWESEAEKLFALYDRLLKGDDKPVK
jgi:glycosyltransferase involved in cell wall biosynthesis